MSTTSDRNDPRLTHGVDSEPVPMAEAYLVLSEEERAKGFVRPVRRSYVHETCGAVTRQTLNLPTGSPRGLRQPNANASCSRCLAARPAACITLGGDVSAITGLA